MSTQPFATRLKAARARLGVSQAALCRDLDIPARTLESWEMGERTPAPLLQRLLLREIERSTPTQKNPDLSG